MSTVEQDHTYSYLIRYNGLVEREIFNNRTSLRRAMQRPVDPFPAPIRLGENSIAWRLRDVEDWLERREAAK